MRYLKMQLVDGDTVSAMNRRLSSAEPCTKRVGHIWKTVEQRFDDGRTMLIMVLNYERDEKSWPGLRVELRSPNDESLVLTENEPGPFDRDYYCDYGDDSYRLTLERTARTSLADGDLRGYVEQGGGMCPYCTSQEVDAGQFRLVNNISQVQADVTCFACGAVWQNQYQLRSMTPGEGPTQNVGPPPIE